MKRIVTNAVRRAKGRIDLHEGRSRDKADDSWAEMAAVEKIKARYCIDTSAGGLALPDPVNGPSLPARGRRRLRLRLRLRERRMARLGENRDVSRLGGQAGVLPDLLPVQGLQEARCHGQSS